MTPERITQLRRRNSPENDNAEMLDEVERLRQAVGVAHRCYFGSWFGNVVCPCGWKAGPFDLDKDKRLSRMEAEALHAAHLDALLNGGAS